MKSWIKWIVFSCLLILSLSAVAKGAQTIDSVSKRLKKQSLIVSVNGIYNRFTNNTVFTVYNPSGRTPNSTQMVYFWQYRYSNTYTYDIGLQYNRFISEKFSLSAGIRFDQLKRVQTTLVYVDSNSVLPDQKKYTYTRYSVSAPLAGNLYSKRFKIGLGFNAYFFSFLKTVYLFENNDERKFSQSAFGIQLFGQESVAYRLFKNKSIYLQLGLIHSLNFDRDFGYNNFFTMGLCIESFFARQPSFKRL